MNNSSYTDKFMVIDKIKENNPVVRFFDGYTGVANCVAQYRKHELPKLKVLKSRNDMNVSYRSIDLIPKFTIKFIDDTHSHFYLQPIGHDPIPFGVPKEGDLCEAVMVRDVEEVYTVLLKDYSHMLLDLDLVHDLDPV